jgi:hypothetical protein
VSVIRITEEEVTALRDVIAESKALELDERALTAAHLAVEDCLIEFRDSRISVMGPANGFVVRERDGSQSPVMRLGTREGLEIAIRAYLAATNREVQP